MRFAICNELFQGWDFKRIVDFVADTGYDGLEIAPFTLADSVVHIPAGRREELKKIAADRGIALTGLHWLLVKPEGLHVTTADEAVRQRTIDYLRHLVDFCGDVGGKVMVFGSPNQRSIPEGTAPEEGWKRALDSFAACGDTAKSRGVTLCLEALPAGLTNLLNTNAQVIAAVKEINHPNIRMMVDVKSMCAESMPVADNIRACDGWFRYVHANDANLKGPGFGDVDFKPIFQALTELSYAGYVSVEVFDFTEGPETIARKSLEYMRSCLPAGEVAGRSR
jgi:sugar phosphate isomerase/epimerase